MEKPQGKLIAIGGAVDRGTGPRTANSEAKKLKFMEWSILKRFLYELKGDTGRVEVITSASQIPEEIGKTYIDAFNLLNNTNVGLMHIKEKEQADTPEMHQRIREAEGVLFTGGTQLLLRNILEGTEFIDIVKQRYLNEHFIVAGTSAGAMVMPEVMICQGSSSEALLKGKVMISHGFGLISKVTIDSHFIKRGRFGRLCQSVASKDVEVEVGIGLGEDTGLLITGGDHMEAIGSGLVILVEGDGIKYTNVAEVAEGEPMSIEGLTVHILSKGHSYILSERRVTH